MCKVGWKMWSSAKYAYQEMLLWWYTDTALCTGHLKENTIHLPEVAGLEADFLPVFGLCTQIAKFLEKTGEMSWSARRILEKDDLSEKAKTYSHRVDDVSCQVMIKLNIRARSPRYASFSSTSSSLESDHCPRRGSTDSADNRIPLESDDGSSTHQSVHQNTNVIVAKHARRTVSIVFISVFIMGVIWILVSQ